MLGQPRKSVPGHLCGPFWATTPLRHLFSILGFRGSTVKTNPTLGRAMGSQFPGPQALPWDFLTPVKNDQIPPAVPSSQVHVDKEMLGYDLDTI